MSFTRKVLRAAERKQRKARGKAYVEAANQLAAAGKLTPETPHDVATRLIGTHGERLMREDEERRLADV